MIANNLKPFQPTHPGEVLKDELEYRGISQRGLAKEIGISYSAFNEMLNGKRSLSPELAMMMEAALGVDAAPPAGHAERIRHADGRAQRLVYGET